MDQGGLLFLFWMFATSFIKHIFKKLIDVKTSFHKNREKKNW